MFNSNKNLTLIDYQDSYFYQQQRKKQRCKWVKFALVIMLLAILVAVIVPSARASLPNNELGSQTLAPTENALTHGPQLIFSHPDNPQRIALPIDITANIEISGMVAYAQSS